MAHIRRHSTRGSLSSEKAAGRERSIALCYKAGAYGQSSGECPMTLFQPPRPPFPHNLSLRAILHAWTGEGAAISRQCAGVPPPRDCFVAMLLAMTPAWTWGAPLILRRVYDQTPGRDESLQLLLGFRIWSLGTQGDSPLCTPSQVWRPNEFSIPLSGRILGRVVG